jgi:outer membrane immunogenic protein
MHRLTGLMIAALLTAAPAAGLAADSTDVSADFVDPIGSSEFDWDGFYAGVHGVGQASAAGGGQLGLGVNLGVNSRLEFVLVGAEVAVQGLSGSAGMDVYLQTIGRVGVAATDEIVIYGAGGLGLDVGPGASTDALVGAGVELALTDNVSLRGQYLHGFDLTGANPKDQLSLGANFHF